jgi:hypothetical protein
MKEILRRQNQLIFLPASLLGASAGICQRTLVDESEMISIYMGTHDES